MPEWPDMPNHHPLNTVLLDLYRYHHGQQLKARSQCTRPTCILPLLRRGLPSIITLPSTIALPGRHLVVTLVTPLLQHRIHLQIHLLLNALDLLYIMALQPGRSNPYVLPLQQTDVSNRRHRKMFLTGLCREIQIDHLIGEHGVEIEQAMITMEGAADQGAQMRCMQLLTYLCIYVLGLTNY